MLRSADQPTASRFFARKLEAVRRDLRKVASSAIVGLPVASTACPERIPAKTPVSPQRVRGAWAGRVFWVHSPASRYGR